MGSLTIGLLRLPSNYHHDFWMNECSLLIIDYTWNQVHMSHGCFNFDFKVLLLYSLFIRMESTEFLNLQFALI